VRVVVNMAASMDSRVAGSGGDPVQLSCPADVDRVHALRARVDAVVVGVGTVLADDPRLTARRDSVPDEQPLRVVADSTLRTPSQARVLDDEADTVILAGNAHADASVQGASVLAAGESRVDLDRAVDVLADRGVESMLVEGGPTLAASWLASGHVDRFTLYTAPRVLGEGPSLAEAFEGLDVDLVPRSRGALGEGLLACYGVQA
jgi:2,5-diamino-6-hydroxy-4-(5-phosphoribosylamino)pyrimidine 1'-reductase